MICKAKYNTSGKRTVGFTLIELLVVIAIIALLLSILMPSLRYAREMARESACGSQMRQIGLYLQMYASDHNDRFPEPADGYGGPVVGGYPVETSSGEVIEPAGLNALWAAGLYEDDDITVNYCPAARARQDDGMFAWEPIREGNWQNYPRLRNGQPDGAADDWRTIYTGYGYWVGHVPDDAFFAGMRGFREQAERAYRRAVARDSFDRPDKVAVTDLIASTKGSGRRLSDIRINDVNPQNPHHVGGRMRGGNVMYLDGSVRWYDFRSMLNDYENRLRLVHDSWDLAYWF